MRINRGLFVVGILLYLLLSACTEAPQTAQEKAPAKPPEPVTGQSALFQMYSVARAWAPDLQILRLRSIPLTEVRSAAGKAGAWEAVFVSRSKGQARSYTYSVVESGATLHQGVFAGAEESYAGPRGQDEPFPADEVKVDTDAAYETALKKAAEYASKYPNTPVNFVLERTPRHPNPAWRVLWGESASTSPFSVLVDSVTGNYLETLH